MTAPRIRADHDQLKTISAQFQREENSVAALITQLREPLEVLRGGDWQGRGATAFYAEMDQSCLPALQRLKKALAQAGSTVQRISARLREAEAEAAAVLRDRTAFDGRTAASLAAFAGASSGGSVLGKIGGFLWDLVSGGASELVDMAKGIVSLVTHPIQTLQGLWYGVTHPRELWEAFSKPYVEDWNNGHPGRAIGRGLVFVASFLLGTKGSDKAAKAGSLSGKAGELGEVAGEAGKLGEVASGLGKVGELSLPRWMAEVSEPFRGLSKPVQATGDLTELMRSATAGQSALAEATEGVAKLTGGRAEIAPLKFASEKGMQRVLDKVASYGGDASQLKDLVRSRVVYGSLDEAYAAVKTVAEKFEIVGYKDRFIGPMDSGFRDILMNVKLPNGHIGELRLSTETIEAIAKIEHPVYEQVRAIRDAATAAGRTLTSAEEGKISELMAPFRPMYDNAYSQLLQKSWANLTPGAPGIDAAKTLGRLGVAGEILNDANQIDRDDGD